jgi:polar amino acid transport system substrate-binding protein
MSIKHSTSRTRTSLAIPVIAAALFALTACSSPSSSPSTTTASSSHGSKAVFDKSAAALLPASTKKSKTLVAVTNAGYPPYEFYASDNKTILGRDVDFAQAIGKVLGIKVKLQNVSFEAIIPGIQAGRYQIAISGLTVTAERKKVADFVAYDASGDNIAVPPGNPKKLEMSKFETLCGKTIGTGTGSSMALVDLPAISKQCTDAGKPAIKQQNFAGVADHLALASGRLDAIMDDGPNLAYLAKNSKGAFDLGPGPDILQQSSGIALAKDSNLTPAISAAVKELLGKQKSVIEAINVKWGIPAKHLLPVDEVDVK